MIMAIRHICPLVLIIQITVWSGVFSENDDIRLPPLILSEAKSAHVYKEGDTITLVCKASGIPDPTYTWYKNDVILELHGRITQPSEEYGNIVITGANEHQDNGNYTCRATNKYGIALGRKTEVKQASIHYESPSEPVDKTVNEGDSLKLVPFNSIVSFPEPTFSWKTVENSDTNKDPRKIVTSRRIALDPDNGALYFANIQPSDSNARIYKLDVRNNIEDQTRGGSPYRINVTPNPTKPSRSPSLLSPRTEEHTYIGIKGKNATLMCFFSGYPTPEVTWRQPPNYSPSRIDCTKEHSTQCVIRNLEHADEGDYTCTGRNSQGRKDATIHLKVQSVPTFTEMMMMSVNVTEGGDANFKCVAEAKPPADIEWYSNGDRIDPDDPGNKIIISKDRTTLKVRNVCKKCQGTTKSDLQVFQCKISNKHGEDYASAYLNVLEPTEIFETGPESVELIPDDMEMGMVANFTCRAKTDPLIMDKLVTSWWYGEARIYNGSNGHTLKDDNAVLYVNLSGLSDNEIQEHLGDYECRATGVYSNAMHMFNLKVRGVEPTNAPQTANIGALWWVFLIIFIILLLLICCICCVMYVQRNKGDEYPVDEKERENGNDPIAELEENDFHDYQRPIESATLKKGSRASLGSTQRLDSMDDLSIFTADLDGSRYDEDGSFIENYGTSSRRQLIVPHHSVSEI